ncbi:hypothetical protein ONZ43_g2834 [Nemania bipapillata]|uniref:Uncharacterized protein n=1 Tax=Nemania bipapillata TaxID=110536 RepID=A0ACC2IZG6_9PEZI|nr:hypothetical protein ONZ43_g2834 [Nemania bipapillata]
MLFYSTVHLGLALANSFTSARVLTNRETVASDWLDSFVDIHPRQTSNVDGPSCRYRCGSCGSSCSSAALSKRDLTQLDTFNITSLDDIIFEHQGPHDLLKRSFRNIRQAAIGSYLKAQTSALVTTLDNPNTNLVDLIYLAEQNEYTFAILKKFSDYNQNVLKIGTGRLEGCTVLTIISRSASHIFEDLAFSPDGNIDPATAFQQNCLNFITGQGAKWKTKGDSLDPSLFTGDNGPAVAFIMTPRPDQNDPTPQNPNPPVPGPNEQMYEAQITQLSQTIQSLIPGLNIINYNYIALNPRNQDQDWQGKALFEYDPDADGNSNPNFRLWYEQTMRNGDGWNLT